MTFGKDFPSLKGLTMAAFVEDDGDLGYELDILGDMITITDVEKHCLDKQKIKEAIERLKQKYENLSLKQLKSLGDNPILRQLSAKIIVLEELEMELGL